jgi:hypothetical protein
LLDPAGVDPNEFYLTESTRLQDIKDMRPEEAEYYHQEEEGVHGDAECAGPSVYPGDGDVMCPYGAAFAAESAAGYGAWVASARQLVKVFTVLTPPHCEDDDEARDEQCLLKASWREQVEERPEYFPSDVTWFVGLRWFLHDTLEMVTTFLGCMRGEAPAA